MIEATRSKEFLRRASEALTQVGFYVYQANIGKYEANVARKAVKSARWLGRPAHFFVFLSTAARVEAGPLGFYQADCLQHAIENKPGPSVGILGSVTAIGVLASDVVVEGGLAAYLDGELPGRFAAYSYPVVANVHKDVLVQRSAPVERGSGYAAIARGIIEGVLVPALPPRFRPKGGAGTPRA